MDATRYETIKKILAEVLQLPPDEREAHIVAACRGETDIAREVRELIAFDPGRGPDTAAFAAASAGLAIGHKIAGFTVLEVLGEGGMGVVFLAEQHVPLRRQVALKVIKVGMDTSEVIGRFESERQALAMMDHPGIAKVHEAGATEEGRPYFAMEYIAGVPITEYCRLHKLDLETRLRLFVQVCRAIHHAHQRGVIHRDLKPGNILVVGEPTAPTAKVIDFGVAKAIRRRLTERTVLTQLGMMVGTPEYMSPEQADPGERDIDVRCDVYALGVVLYELLTGTLPIERDTLLKAGIARIAQLLRETEPKAPSTVFHRADVAERASGILPVPPRTWSRRLRGDLDWVTLKAIERDRERRYGSPAELADDVDRFLGSKPVQAGPPSAAYRVRKFVRRHRTGVVAATLILAALVVGMTGTTIGMIRAGRAEDAAVAAARKSEAGRLFQLARNAEMPWQELPYLLEAIRLDDRPEYRIRVDRSLLIAPPLHQLPIVADSHHPYRVSFSPDGNWLAVGWSASGSLQLYPMAGGEPVDLVGHMGCINYVDFTRDSQKLVTAGYDSTVRVWSVEQPDSSRSWKFRGEPIPFLCRGDSLLVVCENVGAEPFHWWSRSLAWEDPRLLGDTGPPVKNVLTSPAPAADPAGRLVAVPEGDQLVLYALDDLAGGRPRTIGTHPRPITGAMFSPDGANVLAFDPEGTMRIWDASADEPTLVREILSGRSPAWVRYSPDGRRLLVSSTLGYHIWDLDMPRAARPLVLRGSNSWSFDGGFHPTLPWFLSTHTGYMAAAWSMDGQRRIDLALPEGMGGVVGFSPDGNWLVTATHDEGTVHVWPLDGDRIGEPVTRARFPGYGFVKVFFDDASRYCYLTTCNSPDGVGTLTRIGLAAGEPEVWSGGSCDGTLDATGRYFGFNRDQGLAVPYVRILDLETGRSVDLSEPDGGARYAWGFVDDGRLLASGAAGLGLWSTDGQEFERLGPAPELVVLAPDRRTMLVRETGDNWSRGRYDDPQRAALPVVPSNSDYYYVVVDSQATLMMTTLLKGGFELMDLERGRRHRIPLYDGTITRPAFDVRRGRMAAASAGVVSLVPIPVGHSRLDMDHDEYLAWLSALTNLRLEPSETKDTGYEIVAQGIPDWGRPPRW